MRIDKCGVVVGRIIAYGETLQLDFVDTRGIPITLLLPFDQARELTTSLPTLLTYALRAPTQDSNPRHVFALDRWHVEVTPDSRLMITLTSSDGFEVSFGMTRQECLALARGLRAEIISAAKQEEAASI
jgi:hypothetical protein